MLNLIGGLQSIGLFEAYPIASFLPIRMEQIIPASIYFFIVFLINPKHQIKRWEYALFVPFIIDILQQFIVLFRFLSPRPLTEVQLNRYWEICNFFDFLPILVTITILFWGIRTIDNYNEDLQNWYSEYKDISLKWLKYTLICGALLTLLWAFVAYTDFTKGQVNQILIRTLWLGLSINIYWIGYSMFFRRELFENDINTNLENEKNKNTGELSVKAEEHYAGLLNLMSQEKLYQNPDLSMSILSEYTGLSNGYLSQIINQKEGKNFFYFVNKYRVDEVKNNLNDPNFAHYSILGIALKSGFKSKSTFNAVFKKMTGETPSMFKRKME